MNAYCLCLTCHTDSRHGRTQSRVAEKYQKKHSCTLFDSFSAHYLCVYSCLWMHTDSNDGYTMTDLIGWEQSTDGKWKQRGFTVLPTRILVKTIACDDQHRMSSIVARSSILVVKPTPVQVVMHTHTHTHTLVHVFVSHTHVLRTCMHIFLHVCYYRRTYLRRSVIRQTASRSLIFMSKC